MHPGPRQLGHPEAGLTIAFPVPKANSIHRALNPPRACDTVPILIRRLYDEQRAHIAAAFGQSVPNGCGDRHAGLIVHEPSHDGMHVSVEGMFAGIADAKGRALLAGESA
jgi:hypothetical protein